MGAVEHLKTLCCLGLPPESAMVAVVPVLHEIIPHGWSRLGLVAPDATIAALYAEHPAGAALARERLWTHFNDPTGVLSLWVPLVRALGIGWTLPWQGRKWFDLLPFVHLTRPRCARPFTVDDVQRLDRLRPWLGHAFRRSPSGDAHQQDQAPISTAGPTLLSGQLIVTADARLLHRTAGVEHLLRILAGEPGNYTRFVPICDRLPAPVLKLLRQITGAANGTSNAPPRMQLTTAYGILTLEAKWLVPAGTLPEDVARDPKSCLIAVTIELREHPIAHAARVLRESGATPAQVKVGIQLALGKTKPVIADELGIQLSSVVDVTKKLYQSLDIHNSVELATKIWLGQRQDEARQSLRRAG